MSPTRVLLACAFSLMSTSTLAQIGRVEVVSETYVFVTPYVRPEALALAEAGAVFTVIGSDGDWHLVEFESRRHGRRRGYVHREHVRPLVAARPAAATKRVTAPASNTIPAAGRDVPEPVTGALETPASRAPTAGGRVPYDTPAKTATAAVRTGREGRPSDARPLAADRPVTLNGYVDWNKHTHLVIEGQRVWWTADTRLKGQIDWPPPVGVEAKVKGIRRVDGTVWADEIELKPNGLAAFERELAVGGDALERASVDSGLFLADSDGSGSNPRITTRGPDVNRCADILRRLLPPSHRSATPRVYIVETRVPNAAVLPNGSVWVYRGLLDDVRSDDELAVVLGHELAHFTHEHQRRRVKREVIGNLVGTAVHAAIRNVESAAAYELSSIGARLAISAWFNGYSRDQEAQADRVGLRYAYEAGFDVTSGPGIWARMASRGDLDPVSAFFLSRHPRSITRMEDMEREIALNYLVDP